MKSTMGNIFAGMVTFSAGVIVGAAAGFLLAPRSGKETRKHLKLMADETGEHMSRITDETKQVFSGVVKHGKQLVNETGEHLESIKGEARETGVRILERGKELAG
jgi:gas vesicle protein